MVQYMNRMDMKTWGYFAGSHFIGRIEVEKMLLEKILVGKQR